ncbi:hypothetical protein [Lachnoclostridium phytofermentans]|uniref:Uncharacterized protein n=1 Tax=Lachnoclostridium phytofermentans (strain ATCC 700394 / DSM 18823 / ISDg) TaxID=357809 RepID=A9KQ21_LACP7|nr:hypothetical protein [Lachnoclostridium phytofermentans]ABX43333.1 hypothetical protein Cphy_2976 [Lachnoclostridium phytofermentans ISDg]
MKNIIKKIFIIALVATITVMPSTTALAASYPTAVVYEDTVKYFDFRPDNYILKPGESLGLDDIFMPSGFWQVPPFQRLNFSVDMQYNADVRIVVVKTTGNTYQEIKNEVIYGSMGFSFTLPMSTQNETYKIVIVGFQPVPIYGYCARLVN